MFLRSCYSVAKFSVKCACSEYVSVDRKICASAHTVLANYFEEKIKKLCLLFKIRQLWEEYPDKIYKMHILQVLNYKRNCYKATNFGLNLRQNDSESSFITVILGAFKIKFNCCGTLHL